MAHCIEINDRMYSTEGYSWHGLDTLVESITPETVKPILFDIIEGEIMIDLDGEKVRMEGHKALIADYRQSKAGIELAEGEELLLPLHIPKSGYKVITNREILDVAAKSLKDVDAKITSAMSLENGKKFALSVNLGADVLKVNNDEIHAHLNLISSHDGTMNLKAYDSTTRIVCMNTLIWSLQAAGEVGFTIRHTKNADLALTNLPELINNILKGRTQFKEVMEFLASCKVDSNEAIAMAAGYFAIETENKLSTRSYNAAMEIVNLFANGRGNSGRSLYDLANGATEYWTSGDGVGRNADAVTRAYKADFGQAAIHKSRFVDMLADEDRRNQTKEVGREALAAYLAN